MNHRTRLCAVLLLLPIVAVRADEGRSPWFATALVGAADQARRTLDFSLDGSSTRARSGYDAGLLVGAAVGYRFADAWRAEAEFTYQSTSVEGNPFAGTDGPAGNGNHAATTLAVNLYREFDLIGSPAIRTYVGAGAVFLTENDIDLKVAGQPRSSFSGNGVGVQFLLGARYELGRHWFFDLGLRQLIAGTIDMKGEGRTEGRIRSRFEPRAITFVAGWRF